ncbi:MAG: hypothetical protein M3Q39_10015 [Actinomycetota bacterium]|nr:hypothetical protein [Actinomycetota bacterium]
MAARGTETVLFIRPGQANRLGEPGAEVIVATLEECIIYPRSSSEQGDRGIHTIRGLHIAAPQDAVVFASGLAGADQELRGSDEIEARGQRWVVDGAVGDWRKKDGEPVVYLFETMRPEDA